MDPQEFVKKIFFFKAGKCLRFKGQQMNFFSISHLNVFFAFFDPIWFFYFAPLTPSIDLRMVFPL